KGQAGIDAATALQEQRRQGFRQQAAMAKRLAAINREFLDRFAEAHGAERGEKVRKLYREAAYPTLYPDREDPSVLFRTCAEREDLTIEQKEAIEQLVANYQASYASICKEFEQHERQWQEVIDANM